LEIGCVDVEALEEPVVVWGQYYAVNGSVLSNVETAHWSVRREDARGWHMTAFTGSLSTVDNS
jgi:hypothetical protein